MKNYSIRFAVAALAFIVGVSGAYLHLVYAALSAVDRETKAGLSQANLPIETSPVKNYAKTIEVQFLRFVPTGDRITAEFEVTNDTAETAYYISYEKGAYPFPKLKRSGKILQDNKGRCGTGLGEHALAPGETVIFRVPESELISDWSKDSEKELKIPTQIGFPISTGKAKRAEIIWSDEISFHKTIKR